MEAPEDSAAVEPAGPAAPAVEAPWLLILLAGGSGWLIVTVTALLWMQPMSGKTEGETYYMTSVARLVQHLLVFAVSALAYRATLWRAMPSYSTRPKLFVAVQVVLALSVVRLAPIASALAAGLIDHRMETLHDTLDYWRPFAPDFRSWLTPMQFFLPPYLLGLALITTVRLARDYHRESLHSARLSAAYAETRLTMLSMQLQPHFLFNALHAIAELINEDAERATEMLARLGDFLRHALDSSKQPWGSVATEIAGLEAYLAVQQARFRDRLSVTVSVPKAAADVPIPAMLLQPLAENAIEHGRSGPSSELVVAVDVAVDGDRLRIAIRNSTPQLATALSAADYGHGLNNVTSRLHAGYGSAARLHVGPDPRGGTTATIEVPTRRKP